MEVKKMIIMVGIVLSLIALDSNESLAKSNEELAKENEELRQRVSELESKLDRVLSVLDKQGKEIEKRVTCDECSKMIEVTHEGKKPLELVTANLPLSVYGHIKLDGSYDDTQTNNGNTAMWVLPEATDDDEEFNLTTRHSRLGLLLNVPPVNGVKTDGRLEVDFYGKEDEISNNLRLRHAYFTLGFENDWTLLAGQTNDVHAPLCVGTLNTCVGWNVGNIGYRRPQVRVEKFLCGRKLKLQLAAARPYGTDHDADGTDDGENSGKPDMQARVSYKFAGPAEKPIEVGLGGHWGVREITMGGVEDDYNSWSVALDARVPLFENLTLECELWTGQLLESYRGGIGQGFNITAGEEIRSKGGFAQLVYVPTKSWKMFTGLGMDDPNDDDLVGSAKVMRSRNRMIFLNVRRNLTKNVWVGLEYQRFVTEYKGRADADDNRIQTTFCFGF